ncbi:30S ribosomal protein S1, partial [Streptomyces sp. NPDC005813]
AEAQQRFEQHQAQVIKSREADAQAAAEGGDAAGAAPAASGGGSYSSESADNSGALASDEALAALREKLAGGQS